MTSFDRPRENDGAAEPPGTSADVAELDALRWEVRRLTPHVIVSLVSPGLFPPREKHLQLAYQHRDAQIVFDAEADAGLYRWRGTGEVVGSPEQLTAAALGVARYLGAPVLAVVEGASPRPPSPPAA